jgi:hypothetical protein
MKNLIYFLTTIAVISLAFWAYQESFQAKSALKNIKTINRDIKKSQEKLSVLRTEWAYLNRPDRLRALADMNFEKLMLIELNTKHFESIQNFELKAHYNLKKYPIMMKTSVKL